jgi:uncharacterized metal-binding protein
LQNKTGSETSEEREMTKGGSKIMDKSKHTVTCNVCSKQECWSGNREGIPAYCQAHNYSDIIDKTKMEYSAPETIDIYKAASKVLSNGYGKWPRIQEAVEFVKELKLNKIGFASCIALIPELRMTTELFAGVGLDVVCAACQIGTVSPEARGVPELKDARGVSCNPIAQAEILNSEGTQLNFVLGLCLGHDILFNRYSKAPVSTLIVKDRVTGNSPAAALYGFHQHQNLLKNYCDKGNK